MIILVLLANLLVSVETFSQINISKEVYIESYAKDEVEIKQIMLFKVVTVAIVNQSKESGFDYHSFKRKLDKRFEVAFEEYKKRSIQQKFGKNYLEELTELQRKEFLRGINSRRDNEFRKFSGFLEILDKSEVTNIVRDNKKKNIWKGSVKATLNRVKLNSLVRKVVSADDRPYSKIFLLTDVTFKGLPLPTKSGDKNSFASDVSLPWVKWLSSNLPGNVAEAIYCQEGCLEDFEDWLYRPQTETMKASQSYSNSLWLRVSIIIEHISFEEDFNERKFTWTGHALLIDANTKRVLVSEILPKVSKRLKVSDPQNFMTNLSRRVYQLPLPAFKKFTPTIEQTTQLNRVTRLVIKGYHAINDVLMLMDILRKEGRGLSLELQLEVFSANSVRILGFYQGEEKSFSDLLSRLKELKLSHSYQVISDQSGTDLILNLITD